jgi:hypothetical protein
MNNINNNINNNIKKIQKLITLVNIIIVSKIIAIYVLTFLTFYEIEQKKLRLIYASFIYLISIYLFNVKWTLAILYICIAIACVITESLYVTFCKDTWVYKTPDIINIPYWLLPLWSIAFLLMIELINIVKKI